MKRKFTLLALTVFIATILFAGCSTTTNTTADNSLKDIKSKGKFVVGLDDTFAPMGFRDANNNIVGFDIDMATEAAKRMGVKVEFKPVQWDGIILSLNNKDIDVIWNGLTITPEREKQIIFSKPYLQDKQVIVVKQGSTVKTKADLAGKTVGLQLGSSSETALSADAATSKSLKEIKKYSTNTDALIDLKDGRIDAVVIDEVVGRYYATKTPGVYKVLDDNFGTESYGVGIRKTDVAFKTELDKILDGMKSDGTADKISQKWFGKSIITK